MIYLILSVCCSSYIFVVFKLFERFKVQTVFAIIVNYWVAATVGYLLYEGEKSLTEIPEKSWFIGSLALGLLFILVFNLMARTSQKIGVSAASVATKMSLAIPVLFGLFLYNEKLSLLKVIGVVLALIAVYFASVKEKTTLLKKGFLLLPILVFIGSGCIDAALKFFEETHIKQGESPLFSSVVFASAGCIGILFVIVSSFKNPLKVNFKNILAGIALGIPNYFSIYFLIKALRHPDLNSASIFTINNVAIVMLSTLLGILLFKEQISLKNWGGIALAVISIFLVALF